MMYSAFTRGRSVFLLGALITLPAAAQPLGQLNITGTASVGLRTLRFSSDGKQNTFHVESSSGVVVRVPSSEGTINDIDLRFVGTFPATDFLSLKGTAGSISLNFIFLGLFSPATCGGIPAVGQTCSPSFHNLSVTAFNLQNLPPDPPNLTSTLSLVVAGIYSANGSTHPVIGVFTMPFDKSFQAVLDAMLAPGLQAFGTVETSYSATFSILP